jgi:hypothetical protein
MASSQGDETHQNTQPIEQQQYISQLSIFLNTNSYTPTASSLAVYTA